MQAQPTGWVGRILAVDDCPVQRVLLTRQLEASGYLVVAVETGGEALDAARYGRFDAVILDVNMPGMDGPHVGRALRADPVTGGALIVMHSTESEAAVKKRFGAFDAFLGKPSTPRQLTDLVDALIRTGGGLQTA